MVRKFLKAAEQAAAGAGETGPSDSIPVPDDTFQIEYFFFYGTLMDPSTLADVLNRNKNPPGRIDLRPAKIIGYTTKLCGVYPALIDGAPGDIVHGVACEIRSPTGVERLSAYETGMYRIEACRIYFEDVAGDGDGSTVMGKTFAWNADKGLLREGRFDLKDWVMRRREMELHR